MLYKIMIKPFFIVLVVLFISACVESRYTKDLMTDDEQFQLYLQLGIRYLEMNMLSIAKDNLENAANINPDNAIVHNILAVLYERLKKNELASSHFKQALYLDPNNASIKNNYGRFLCERGSYPQGIELLNEALVMPLNNKKWIAYTNMGLCELKHNKPEVSEHNFRRALQSNKQYSPALFEMQKVSYRAGKYMSSRAFLERYLAIAQHNAETLWYGVQTERALGNKLLADEYRYKLFLLFPGSKQAQQLQTAIR